MITKLPGWVWIGAAVLAVIGGMVNAVGFLGLSHEAITHLTGTTTLSAIAVAKADWPMLAHLVGVLFAYFAGSVLSGFIIRQSTLKLGRRYGVVLLIESLLLFIAMPLLLHHIRVGDYLATGACGLQNAMATSYSGAIIRTTHLSGIVTDLGILLGQRLRGIPLDRRRTLLGSTLFVSFFSGGLVGALLFAKVGYYTLLLPAALTGLTGLGYTAYKMRAKG